MWVVRSVSIGSLYPRAAVADPETTISPAGKAEAEAELEHLRNVRRPEIVASIKEAREFGDLSENAEYHAAREAQGLNESRIRVLEHHLAAAEVREASKDGSIEVGSKVSYRDLATDRLSEVTLVHQLEADLATGKLSAMSPIGKALLGRRAGERVTLNTPRGKKELEVVQIG
jgi:transcription elongation factor GreA